jgi:hypothetical protein
MKQGGNPDSKHVRATSANLTLSDRWTHLMARMGIRRKKHLVEPGLYALGKPDGDSPVLVTANYKLSFDALRSELEGIDAYILVLDTKGVNVWCAAGEGTFGTDELVRRIELVNLKEVTNHRALVLPQLGAPGVSAHEVKQESGFRVKYGPVKASDVPDYLERGEATPEMRRVRFPLWDRAVLIGVEFFLYLLPVVLIWIVTRSPEVVAALLAGVILFPLLLPVLPTRDFSTKGFLLGFLVVLPLAVWRIVTPSETPMWRRAGIAAASLLAFPPLTAFLSLNFTGATTFTSRSGVRREIFSYFRSMVWLFAIGVLAMIAMSLVRIWGVE